MHSVDTVSDMTRPSFIQKLAYRAAITAAMTPARRPATRPARRPTTPTVAAPSTAISSRCASTGSSPKETGAATRTVRGGWSAASRPGAERVLEPVAVRDGVRLGRVVDLVAGERFFGLGPGDVRQAEHERRADHEQQHPSVPVRRGLRRRAHLGGRHRRRWRCRRRSGEAAHHHGEDRSRRTDGHWGAGVPSGSRPWPWTSGTSAGLGRWRRWTGSGREQAERRRRRRGRRLPPARWGERDGRRWASRSRPAVVTSTGGRRRTRAVRPAAASEPAAHSHRTLGWRPASSIAPPTSTAAIG